MVLALLWLLILLRVSRGSEKSPENVLPLSTEEGGGLWELSSVFILCRSGSSNLLDGGGEEGRSSAASSSRSLSPPAGPLTPLPPPLIKLLRFFSWSAIAALTSNDIVS